MKDPDLEVREAALDALAEFNDPSSAEAVSARLTDTRDKAAAALKAIGRPAEAATIKYLTHDDIWVRTEACKVLEEIGGSEESRAALADVVGKANGFGFDADAANVGPSETQWARCVPDRDRPSVVAPDFSRGYP